MSVCLYVRESTYGLSYRVRLGLGWLAGWLAGWLGCVWWAVGWGLFGWLVGEMVVVVRWLPLLVW